MASLTKRRKSPYWVACYSLADGRRVQRSTKERNKSKAMQMAIALESAAHRKITADTARKLIAELVEMIHGDIVSNYSCSEYFARWKSRRAKEVSVATSGRFDDVFKSFAAYIEKAWDAPLSDLQAIQISGWRDELAKRYAPVTVNIYLKVIKQALKDACDDGLIPESPGTKIKGLKIPKGASSRKVFTLEQFSAILAHADGEWKGMVLAGAYTGQRLSDIAAMKVDQIHDGWWRFQTRKTNADMAIPLAAPLATWIREWLKTRKIASAYVFPDAQSVVGSGAGRSGTLSNRFHRIMVSAGIVPPRDHKKKADGHGRDGKRVSSELSFHSFRHTCTTWLKAQGVSESVAMAFVGHESEAINRSYTHLPEDTLTAAVRQMEKFTVVRAA